MTSFTTTTIRPPSPTPAQQPPPPTLPIPTPAPNPNSQRATPIPCLDCHDGLCRKHHIGDWHTYAQALRANPSVEQRDRMGPIPREWVCRCNRRVWSCGGRCRCWWGRGHLRIWEQRKAARGETGAGVGGEGRGGRDGRTAARAASMTPSTAASTAASRHRARPQGLKKGQKMLDEIRDHNGSGDKDPFPSGLFWTGERRAVRKVTRSSTARSDARWERTDAG